MQLFKLLAIFLQVIKHNRDISRVIMQICAKVDVCDESDDRQKVAWAGGGFYFMLLIEGLSMCKLIDKAMHMYASKLNVGVRRMPFSRVL